MKKHFIPCLKLTLLAMLLFGVVYPLTITAIAKLFSNDGEGKVLKVNNKIVGFEVIGQSFTSDKYFSSRPSAVSYNAAATGGSNKGPSNPDYLADVEKRISYLLLKNPSIKREDIPVDLITASGGGLDPDISPKAAIIQAPRIAHVRNMKEKTILTLIEKFTEKPLFGLFGTSRINVLKINIALDKLK